MAEETIDFGNFGRKILVNPAVVMQVMEVFCRSSSRVQATLLGKVYSSSVEILEAVPISLAENNHSVLYANY